MQQKKFNVVDIIIVAILVVAAVFTVWRMMGTTETAAETVYIRYTVRCESTREVYDNCQRYLPSQLMASGERLSGAIQSVRMEPVTVMKDDGEWVEDINRVILYFNVVAEVEKEDVMTTAVGAQEVRVGKSGHILKSEYIELGSCQIIDVEWDVELDPSEIIWS